MATLKVPSQTPPATEDADQLQEAFEGRLGVCCTDTEQIMPLEPSQEESYLARRAVGMDRLADYNYGKSLGSCSSLDILPQVRQPERRREGIYPVSRALETELEIICDNRCSSIWYRRGDRFSTEVLTYLSMGPAKSQSKLVKSEGMRLKGREIEEWPGFKRLPEHLRRGITRHRRLRCREIGGGDVESLLDNLPKGFQKSTKTALGLKLLMKVPIFGKMDRQFLEEVCNLLKLQLYTQETVIVGKNEPFEGMHFVMGGELLSMPTERGGICWYYSDECRTWAAGFIQAAWRRYFEKKREKSVSMERNRQDEWLRSGGISSSSGASHYTSKFALNSRLVNRCNGNKLKTETTPLTQKLEESLRAEENRFLDALSMASGKPGSLQVAICVIMFAIKSLRGIRLNRIRKAKGKGIAAASVASQSNLVLF
ncbi:hypothetical protein Patl1_27226 [Pistacia atlantica]|uniref:Uncharacterized protein n=1 Tax=Pistacia atlantica TaxID=434234 RepID=A0ACC1BF18_9ROSI|nr:hypothetical protein Patl1_27226 [Pistacia atlantica]